MSQTLSRSRTAVFRACVVNAVRGGEALMARLVQVTRAALTSEESSLRDLHRRNLVGDALRLLNQHEAALVKGYSMALLEIFAEGPTLARGRPAEDTGMDFGELSLMDDREVQDQVELSRVQQLAVHATDAVLGELNTLVSSAQGLRSVQPERNPLRPESYIRALQRVTAEVGVTSEVRQVWMQHMRDQIGPLLAEEYRKAITSLREQGIEPVGYAVTGPARTDYGSLQGGGYAGAYAGSASVPLSGYGPSGYGRGGATGPGGWGPESQQAQLAAEAEEALLTVGILRQMLAGGDPFDARAGWAHGAVPGVPVAGRAAGGWTDSRVAPSSSQGPLSGGYLPQAAAEAMEDIAQLERIVGRLASGASGAAPLSGWRDPGQAPAAPRAYTVAMGGAHESPAMAAEIVARMMENIAQDTRLLPPVLRAVQNLAPALQRLVRHDLRFFSDASHPARRLLDEMTERSLAFPSERAPGFSQFMRLMDEAVNHLTKADIQDAGPFDTVLKALQSAWDTQQQRIKAYQESRARAKRQAQRRSALAAQIRERLQSLPGIDQVPADVIDFLTGPWAEVAALAQSTQDDTGSADPPTVDEDPHGYLAVVPDLLWSAQPERTRHDLERLSALAPGLVATVRQGLASIDYPQAQADAFVQRLEDLHQDAFEAAADEALAAAQATPDDGVGAMAPSAEPTPAAAPAAQAPAPDPFAGFRIGAWVEIVSQQRAVRSQLTWCSPQGTLFLFTGADGSTQSMTRRVRDKLLAEGSLRLVPPPEPMDARRGRVTRPGGL